MADDERYLLTAPRGSGHTPTSDAAYPNDSHHTVAVNGRADLERRLTEAAQLGVEVTYRLDDTDEDVA